MYIYICIYICVCTFVSVLFIRLLSPSLFFISLFIMYLLAVLLFFFARVSSCCAHGLSQVFTYIFFLFLPCVRSLAHSLLPLRVTLSPACSLLFWRPPSRSYVLCFSLGLDLSLVHSLLMNLSPHSTCIPKKKVNIQLTVGKKVAQLDVVIFT